MYTLPVAFIRYTGILHDSFRVHWVKTRIKELGQSAREHTVIDIGAGVSPYKDVLKESGFTYFSQDFNEYVPEENLVEGLQNATWNYAKHDFVCDVLDMPTSKKFSLVLCTEVLEHVPDPVASLEHLSNLVKSGGFILITVPFNSMMHQAPFWFSAGLSPFWFEYWAKKLNLEVIKLELSGDYIDVMSQEFNRLFESKIYLKVLRVLVRCLQLFRKKISPDILSSGACGTLVLLKSK